MKKSVISPPNLEFFLSRLNEKFGQFLVLRGYEFLPNGYTNDIDVYVPRADLARFFDCINNLDGLDSMIVILISRLGLIKCELLLEGEVIPFDVMYGFYYFGLEYQDCEQLSSNSRPHDCELFFTPDLSDEIRISLLKDLLHNSKVRIDKASYFLEMMEKCSPNLPTDYFVSETIQIIHDAIISESLYLPQVSRGLKVRLLSYNLQKQFYTSLKNILLFVAVKYIFKNNYHKRIIK